MQEGEDHYCIIILLGNSNDVQVVVLVEIEQVVVFVFDQRPISNIAYFRVYSSYSRIFLLKTS
jgi:hypothetical protein